MATASGTALVERFNRLRLLIKVHLQKVAVVHTSPRYTSETRVLDGWITSKRSLGAIAKNLGNLYLQPQE
jgi:hypothetical protein